MQKDIAIPITMSFLHNCPILAGGLETALRPRTVPNGQPRNLRGRLPALPVSEASGAHIARHSATQRTALAGYAFGCSA